MELPENNEEERVKYLTQDTVGMHVARVNAVMARYKIIRARQLPIWTKLGYNLERLGEEFAERNWEEREIVCLK